MNTAIRRGRLARTLAVLSIGTLAFALAGCGGADDSPESLPTEPGAQTAPTDEAPDEGGNDEGTASAELGTITVDTTTYDVVETVNCVPVSASDVLTRVFEAITVAQSVDGDEVLFFAYTDEQSGVPGHFIDYQGPEGTWSTSEGNATFAREAGALSGSGVLIDDANTQSIMVQFDFAVPDELVEC